MLVGTVLFTTGMVWFNTVKATAWPGVVVTGLSGSIISSVLWGLVPVTVPDHDVLGIAFGAVHSVENAVIVSAGVTIGALRDSTGNYHASLWCLVFVAVIGVVAAAILVWIGVVPAPLPVSTTSPQTDSEQMQSPERTEALETATTENQRLLASSLPKRHGNQADADSDVGLDVFEVDVDDELLFQHAADRY
jgi:hypothetical protein